MSNADSVEVFKKHTLNFIRLKPNNIYNIHKPLGVKYLTILRIEFSHLKEHKFKHNFQNSVGPMCNCNRDIETTILFFSITQILILKDKPSLTK